MSPEPAPRVTVARVLRARGRVGEVAAELFTDFPERLTRLKEVLLWDGVHEPPRRVAVRRCWLHKGQAIFHFEGCDSISDAERLKNLQVQIPLAERVELPRGIYYVTDLIGCEVYEQEVKEVEDVKEVKERPFTSSTSSTSFTSLIGVVRDVDTSTGTPVLVVDTPRGELLVPLAQEICRVIDTSKRRIEVVLPNGLRELNL